MFLILFLEHFSLASLSIIILNLIFATFERDASFFQPAHSQTRSRFRETEKISYFQIIQRCHGVLRPNQNKNQNCIPHFFVQISHSEVHNEAFLANLFNGRRSEAAGAFCERATSFNKTFSQSELL